MDYKRIAGDIVTWLRNYAENAGAKGFILGLSGGIDSAVVAALCKRAYPQNTLGLIMPCESIEEDAEDAKKIAQALHLEVKTVDLSATYHALLDASFKSENQLAKSNIKPRLRMTTLYYYAQDRGYLVAGPSNGSEWYVGYSTKFGDSAADIFPIVGLLKTDIFQLAKELELPEFLLEKKPSAGLWKGQSDEQEMGFTYEELDNYIRGVSEPQPNIKEKIDRMHQRSSHKRMMAPQFKVE